MVARHGFGDLAPFHRERQKLGDIHTKHIAYGLDERAVEKTSVDFADFQKRRYQPCLALAHRKRADPSHLCAFEGLQRRSETSFVSTERQPDKKDTLPIVPFKF